MTWHYVTLHWTRTSIHEYMNTYTCMHAYINEQIILQVNFRFFSMEMNKYSYRRKTSAYISITLRYAWCSFPSPDLEALSRSPGVSRGPSPSSRAASAGGARGSRCRFLSAEDPQPGPPGEFNESRLTTALAIGTTIGNHDIFHGGQMWLIIKPSFSQWWFFYCVLLWLIFMISNVVKTIENQ